MFLLITIICNSFGKPFHFVEASFHLVSPTD